MTEEIKAGDVVELRSGGPPMSVELVESGIAHCAWIDPKGNAKHVEFNVAALKAVDPEARTGIESDDDGYESPFRMGGD